MPLPSIAGLYGDSSSVLDQPSTVTNPIQNPLSPAAFAAEAKDREARAKTIRMIMQAMALRDEPLNAQGAGPFGARQGVGPAGWATTVGDVVAGVIAEKRRKKATEDVTNAQSQEAPAASDLFQNVMSGRVNPYSSNNSPPYVSQGSPLSLGWDNLGSWKY